MKNLTIKNIFCLVTGFVISILLSTFGYSQAPNSFKYQAVLRDASGAVMASEDVSVAITILQGSESGTHVFTETHDVSTNEFGLISLDIGTVNPADFISIDWSAGPYFFRVSVDGTEMGTSQVLSVPYALYAETAGNKDDADADPENEIQTLSIVGTEIFISDGNSIELPTGEIDLDADPANEIQMIKLVDTDLSIEDGNTVSFTNWDTDETNDVTLTGDQSIDGKKTFTGTVTVNTPVSSTDAVNKEYVDNFTVDAWSPSGNTGTDPLIDFLGTTDENPIVFRVNNTRKMVLNVNGNLAFENTGNSVFVGIGAGKNDDLSNNMNIFIGDSSGYMNTSGYYNTANGYQALYANTSGNHNTAMGSEALHENSSGIYNTATGYRALNSNTIGSSNTATGSNVLFSNTTGNSNTAAGNYSLHDNTTGSYNVAIGANALTNNISGSYNTSCGYNTLTANNTGNYNVAIGHYALDNNTSGNYNTASGRRSLYYNTTGNYNTAHGESSLYYNTTGYSNVAVGIRALYRNTDRGNLVAIGDSALYNNGVGATISFQSGNNTAVGSKALYANTTGFENTALGYHALNENSTGYNNTALGNRALGSNETGVRNVATGYYALGANNGGSHNTAYGFHALYYNSDGNYNTAVGSYSGPNDGPMDLTNTGAFGFEALVNTSNTIQIGNTDIVTIGGEVGWSITSDGRFKTNVKSNVPGLDFILKLNPVTFNWDLHKLNKFIGTPDSLYDNPKMEESRRKKEKKVYTGFIAQEVEAAAEECNYDFSAVTIPEDEKSKYRLSYAEFVVPLVKAVQEQQGLITKQQETIELFIKEIKELKSEIEELKSANKK